MEKTKSMVTGNKARERILFIMWMLFEEGWQKTLCCVLSAINGVTNNVQV